MLIAFHWRRDRSRHNHMLLLRAADQSRPVARLRGFFLIVVNTWLIPVAAAQTCTAAKVTVQIHDPAGKPVSAAEVQLGGVSVMTDAQGLAEFQNVTCGSQTATVAKEGFKALTAVAVEISGQPQVELALTLPLEIVHDSVDVHDTAPAIEAQPSQARQLQATEVKSLPFRPATVADALPLVPGVARAPDGEVKINGTGEHRSALIVNQADVTDPATGQFGQTVPIDSVETVDVFKTPFVAQYGNFTAGVVSVDTRRGGEKWNAELNDPLPEFRIRSWHLRGLRDSTPRALFGGPLIPHRLYFINATQYSLRKRPERTLPFPYNESKQASVNSLSQLDYIVSSKQTLTASLHVSPQHTNFVNPEFFNPQPVTPSFAQHNYIATLADNVEAGGGTLASIISVQRYDTAIGSQGAEEMILTP